MAAFELGYWAAVARLRRNSPWAYRENVLNVLTKDVLDREDLAEFGDGGCRYGPHVRNIRLIVARVQSSASMLSWRRGVPDKQRKQLRAALEKLTDEARRLGAW
jgi:hypothetical protein